MLVALHSLACDGRTVGANHVIMSIDMSVYPHGTVCLDGKLNWIADAWFNDSC